MTRSGETRSLVAKYRGTGGSPRLGFAARRDLNGEPEDERVVLIDEVTYLVAQRLDSRAASSNPETSAQDQYLLPLPQLS
jgi:hypothetical protein